MDTYQFLRDQIADEAGAAGLRFMDALIHHLATPTPGQSEATVGKAGVLKTLQEVEGRAVSEDVIRRRISNLNKCAEIEGPGPLFRIASRKEVLHLSWSAAVVATGLREEAVRDLNDGTDADASAFPPAVQSRFLKRRFRVFISHGWSDNPKDEIEKVKDEFAAKLTK